VNVRGSNPSEKKERKGRKEMKYLRRRRKRARRRIELQEIDGSYAVFGSKKRKRRAGGPSS
jgi:hypothetical protein